MMNAGDNIQGGLPLERPGESQQDGKVDAGRGHHLTAQLELGMD